MMMELERDATLSRLKQAGSGVVLAVEDTTSFNFTHHPATTGLGVIENNRSAGFYAHTTLAVSEDGVPLGLFDQQVWRRDKSPSKVPDAHKQLPITQKESMKWLTGLYQTQGSPSQVIVIGDREADVYELFQEATNRATDLIIRAKSNRCLMSEGKLFEALEQQDFATTFEVEVVRQVNQERRIAQVGLRYASVTLRPPNRPKSSAVIPLTPLTLQVVEVLEINPPAEGAPIHWLLLTTLALHEVQDAQRILRFYTYRWVVERFHYVLKSGCKLEQSQLKSYDALTRFLALCSHQAWQILELTYQARVRPDEPCDSFLSPEQWQALQAHQTGQLSSPCPTLAEATRSIAQLGGFIGRKSDGFPGVQVLWRGWQRLNDLVAMWMIFHPPPKDVGNV